MNAQGQVLQWREGLGWLVLVGGGDLEAGDLDGIYSEAIVVADDFRPVMYIPTAAEDESEAEAILETWQALGGTPGEVLPVWSLEDAENPELAARLREAGVVFLGDGPNSLLLAEVLVDTLLGQVLAEVYAAGAVVVGQGAGAMVLGQVVAEFDPYGDAYVTLPGLDWVVRGVIEPHYGGLAESLRLQRLVARRAGSFGLGLPPQVALALGPEGLVFTWGTGGQVTVALGPER